MSTLTMAKHLVSRKILGVPTASILKRLGQMHYRARVLELCGYWPQVVSVDFPQHFGEGRRFLLTSAGGSDQICWRLWNEGWVGFERPMLDLFTAAAQRSETIFDVGANGGLYSALAGCASDDVAIHAFEPLPQALEVLRENIRLNQLGRRVRIAVKAVADECGTAQFFVPSGNEGLLEMSASLSAQFRSAHSQVIPVEVTTIDVYVQREKIDRVDLLKIDVESQEHRVLLGAERVLAEHRPMIFLEILKEADCDTIDRIKREFDYVVCRLRPTEISQVNRVTPDSECPNQLMMPAEDLSLLGEIAHAAQLRVVRPKRKVIKKPAHVVWA